MSPKMRLLIGLVAAACALSLGSPAAADCSGPVVSASPGRVSPGDEVEIVGHSWGDACNDTGGPGCDPPPLGEPIQDIHLRLRSLATAQTFDLTSVDADDDYIFETTVRTPDVPPGRYEIDDERGQGSFTGPPLEVVDS